MPETFSERELEQKFARMLVLYQIISNYSIDYALENYTS